MRSKFFGSFIQGLSGSGLYADPEVKQTKIHKITLDRRTDLEKLRGDWQKIGGDFRGAIKKAQQSTSRT